MDFYLYLIHLTSYTAPRKTNIYLTTTRNVHYIIIILLHYYSTCHLAERFHPKPLTQKAFGLNAEIYQKIIHIMHIITNSYRFNVTLKKIIHIITLIQTVIGLMLH